MVLRLPSAASSSSKIGSDTTYFSLAQLPRSCIRQRSLQNGKSLCTSESVSVLQIGHLCFIAKILFRTNSMSLASRNSNAPGPRNKLAENGSSIEKYNLLKNSQRRSGSDSVKLLCGRNGSHNGGACIRLLLRSWQNLHHAPNHVVSVRPRNLHASHI